MRHLVPLFLVVTSGCVEGALAHYQATFEHVADCKVTGGVEDCRNPGDQATHIQSRISVDDRGEDSRMFMRQDTLVGPIENNSFHMEQVHEQVYEQSGCKNRQVLKFDGVVDDPGFGMRREIQGELVESSVTDGDPQACGRNVPYGDIKRYKVVATEIYNP